MTTFNGTVANNTFVGSAANDVFNYGNVTYSGATIVGARGQDTISSGGGFDTLNLGNVGTDYLHGTRVGNDWVLQIQPTPDGDDDTAVTSLGGVTVTNFFSADGNGVIDRVNVADGLYGLLRFKSDVFTVDVYSAANVLLERNADGSDGNDSLVGAASDDFLYGFLGNDTLVGGGGRDELEGGGGNDLLIGGAGNDTLRGDAGIDTADYRSANGSVNVDLEFSFARGATAPAGSATNVGDDRLEGIERVIGSHFGDRINGSGRAETLVGGAGNDNLSGGAGNDSLSGGAGFDFFSAGAALNTVAGRGNDTLDGGAITERINYLDLNGVDYAASGGRVLVNLQTGSATDGHGGRDKLIDINYVRGSEFNDSLTGSTALLFELFIGGGGNDTIDGGLITDTLNLTNGNRAQFNILPSAVTVDLLAGTATGQGNDTLTHINAVRGSSMADTLLGSNDKVITETFEGLSGNDLIDGRGGYDVARYDYAANGVVANLATGVATVSVSDKDTLSHIEGLRGSHFNDTLTGGSTANAALEFFIGNGGNDTIDGGAGYDRVDYTNAMRGVTVTLGGTAAGTASDGTPILNGQIQYAGTAGATVGTDTLRHIEAVRGSTFNDTLTGSAIATEETFEGRDGNDVINGRAGPDCASYQTSTGSATITLGLNGAAGRAVDGWGGTDTLRGIENVLGSRDFGDRITGNELANLLDGQGGQDTLAGGAGSDTLIGGAGNDLLVGGSGKDSLTGGTGLDLFRFSSTLNGSTNVDRLADFKAADDTMQLDDAVFARIGPVNTTLATGAFRAGVAAGDAGDRVIYDSNTGQLFYDADGTGSAAQVLFATVAAGTALSAVDIFVV